MFVNLGALIRKAVKVAFTFTIQQIQYVSCDISLCEIIRKNFVLPKNFCLPAHSVIICLFAMNVWSPWGESTVHIVLSEWLFCHEISFVRGRYSFHANRKDLKLFLMSGCPMRFPIILPTFYFIKKS